MNEHTPVSVMAAQHKDLLQRLTACLVNAVPMQQLYLLGLRQATQTIQSIFVQGSTATEVGNAWLLAVVETGDKHRSNAIIDQLENNGRSVVLVTVIVISVKEFNCWHQQGHRFARAVAEGGCLLHGSLEPVESESKAGAAKQVGQPNNASLAATSRRVQEFLAAAELYVLRQQYGLALFMLHQATEQTLHALLLHNTGLRITTHNLDKLIRYNGLWGFYQDGVWARTNDGEKRLFRLLQSAYVESRYGDEKFVVKGNEVFVIRMAVQQLVNTFLIKTNAIL